MAVLLGAAAPASFKDVPYREIAEVPPGLLSLDIHIPEGAGPFPVVACIHGGGWKRGDKREARRGKPEMFTAEGYIFVTLNYRLSPAVRHPAHVEDVAAALAWVHDNIADYGGDRDALFVMGHSAGAHLATLVAVDETRLGAQGKHLSIIKGVISSDHAVFDLPARLRATLRTKGAFADIVGPSGPAWEDFSPRTHLVPDKGIPPFMLFWTTRPVAPGQNRQFLDRLEEVGMPGEGMEVDTTHAGINSALSTPGTEPSKRLFAFLAGVLGESAEPPARQEGELVLTTPDDRERLALVHRPPGPAAGPRPLLIAMHGGGGSAAGFKADSGLDEVADREGFVVVYPEGIPARAGTPPFATWNAGTCCGRAAAEGVDDVAYLGLLVDALVAAGTIDPDRVYATGHSNGAQMAYRLACERPELVAAIAPVGALGVHGECPPGRAVPVLQIHGTEDACALYDGGECGGCFQEVLNAVTPWPLGPGPTWACGSVEGGLAAVAIRAGCLEESEAAVGERSWRRTWTGCADGAEVSLLVEVGAGHAWPGAGWGTACRRPGSRLCRAWQEKLGPLAREIVAAEEIWGFVSRFSLAGPPSLEAGEG